MKPNFPFWCGRGLVLGLVLLAGAQGAARAADDYKLGPDAQPREGVPHGTVTKYTFTTSKIFPGTTRDYWIYVPAQYSAKQPACVMVFQDGGGYVNPEGGWRVPVVLDNLIARKEVPVIIGVFVNPGVLPALTPEALPRFNRSFEYDGLGDAYARFLLEELLPEVEKKYTLAKGGNSRALAGSSSGAIAAFTAAWERPEEFSRVFSTIGTFAGLRGGDGYPTLIRKTEPKPVRVFLQDGSGDLNIYAGNWFLANQAMLSALQFAGYEVKSEWGDGGHSAKHGGAILPDALRWLWRDYPSPVRAGQGSRQPVVNDVLVAGEPWKLVGEGYKFTEGPASNGKGEVFFTDIPNNRIYKIGLNGKVTLFVDNSGGANGLMFGGDGKLYACQNGRKRIVAYDGNGKEMVIADEIESNDLAVAHNGNVYVTDPNNKRVWLINGKHDKRVVDTGLGFPNGVRLTPDQSLLYVSDSKGRFVYSYQIQPDGTLAYKQPYCHLHLPDGKAESGADGMTFDTQGRLYVATDVGLQYCDQAGRVNGIIGKPQNRWLANVVFGGPNLDELFVTNGDKVYRRKTRVKGVLSFQPPLKPPTPKL